MAAVRGEAEFTASDGTVYHIVMDFTAFAEVEEVLDNDIDSIVAAMSPKPRIKHLGALLYGGLKERHPEITPEDALRLLGEGEAVGAAIAKALHGAMPKPESAEGKAKPARGTGTKPRPTGRDKG